MKGSLRNQLPAGLIGGALVAVLVLAFDGTGGTSKTTTVVQQPPLSSASTSAVAQKNTSLTAGQIYKRDAPGVVFIRSQIVQHSQSPFDLFPQQQQQGEATGSGFLIDRNGTILTNAHVVQDAVKITVQLEHNKTVEAKVLGKDPSIDLALLKIPTDGLTLNPLTLGDSSTVQVGDPTLAIGNPFGLDRTLTSGIVSALARQIQAPNGFTIQNVIQTDAPINPGNSGGPLLDASGRVIGINSQIETGGGQGSVGIGFAVPINSAKSEISKLEKSGTVQHAYLGITSISIDGSLSSLNLPASKGALVQSVQAGSPADKAGIKGGNVSRNLPTGQIEIGGDIITAVDGKAVNTSDDLASLIGAKSPGDTVSVTLIHAKQQKTVKVTLGNRPNSVGHPG